MRDLQKRLLHQSKYRGSKEMDILLERFATENIASMSDSELHDYEDILSCDDHDLFLWFTGQTKPTIDNVVMHKLLKYFKVDD